MSPAFLPRRPRAVACGLAVGLTALSTPLPHGFTAPAQAEASHTQTAQAGEATSAGMDPSQRELWDVAGTNSELGLDLVRLDIDKKSGALSASLRITNTADSTATDLFVNTWRGQEVHNPADARLALATGTYSYLGDETEVGDLGPGESTEVTITAGPDSGLGLGAALGGGNAPSPTTASPSATVFPFQFTLTGSLADRTGTTTLATERTLGEVGSPRPAINDDSSGGAPSDDAPSGPELTVLYPLMAKLDILPGETGEQELILGSDNLAGELAPGGRLDRLLDTYLSHDLKGAGCVVLDPALVDTVDRMTGGYRVSDKRPRDVAKPQRLRDSWFNDSSRDRGKEGRGAEDAQAWLDKLAGVDCTIAMPWNNTDPSAVAEVGNPFLVHEALDRGPETIERVAGKKVARDLIVPGTGYVSQPMPHPALVANNSTWHGKAATFDASLGSLLAQAGPEPQTPGYSNPELRFDYADNSEYSRALTSAAALSLAVGSADVADRDSDPDADTNPEDVNEDTGSEAGNAGTDAPPVIAKLASLLDPKTAEETLDTAQRALDSGARPLRVEDVPLVDGAANDDEGIPAGSPFIDPAAFTAPELQQVQQQARYTDELMRIMVNDPNIALTRYGYTLPLRRGLLVGLSVTERESFRSHERAVEAFRRRMKEHADVLRDLRSSVALIPPGNVYTRVSDSSPLLIVAENGLPLPVDARMLYDAHGDARLNTPDQVYIPARGSITVTMTADLPSDKDRTRVAMWLATPEKDAISEPIDITVQTRAGIVSVYGVGLVAALVVILALLFRVGRRKKFGRHR